MSKPYSEEDLSAQLSADLTWRLKEISDLKAVTRVADARSQRVLLRAFVTICYAHWEGFIRYSARKYMEHISLRKLTYAELDRQFYKNYFLPRLAALSMSKTTITDRCELVDEIMQSGADRFSRANDELVNTKANLNHDVFSDICVVCGINVTDLAVDKTFLDVILLKRRNAIAHGEEVSLNVGEMDMIAEFTMAHIRAFKDAIENRIYLKAYRAA